MYKETYLYLQMYGFLLRLVALLYNRLSVRWTVSRICICLSTRVSQTYASYLCLCTTRRTHHNISPFFLSYYSCLTLLDESETACDWIDTLLTRLQEGTARIANIKGTLNTQYPDSMP